MKKFLILPVSLLLTIGLISITWAHGPKRSGSGVRGHSVSKPAFQKPERSSVGIGFRQHLRKSNRKALSHASRKPLSRRGVLTDSRPLPRVVTGTLFGKRAFLRNRRLLSIPFFNRNFGVRLRKQAPEEKELLPASQPAYSSEMYFDNNPNPWFLYGKGKEFRHMGLIPPLP